MPRIERPTLRRASLLGAAFLLATLSCGREVTGPSGTQLMRGFTFDARFDTPGLANGVAGTIVSFTKVRVVLVNSLGDTVVKRVIDFPSNSDSVAISLDVPVVSGAPASGEPMSLALAYINAQNDTVFRGGPLPVQVVASLPGSPPPVPPVVPVVYVGVGANAASVVITPPTLSILAGDPFTFTGVALDGQGAPIANTPIAWRSESPSRATITDSKFGAGVTLPSRGQAMIIAQLIGPSGAADTVLMDVLPRAQSLAVVSGNNQTATFNTQLAQPLVVRVNATDGQGMAGVTVNFAVTAGGGGVSAPSVVTDANGLAQVTWTAGNGLGAQTVSATAVGLAGSPVTFTALAPLTELLHHYPMSGGVSDAIGGANGSLLGGASIVDGTLSLDGTGHAQFASNLIPTTGSFSISLFVRDRGPLALTEYISQGASNGPGFYLGQLASGVLRAGDGWPNTGVNAPAIDGLFHHIVFVTDSALNTSSLYVDGTLRATLPQRTTFSATGDFTRFGRQFGLFNEFLNGDLDEIKIARGALSAAQVTALFTAGVTTSGRLVFSTQPSNVVTGASIAPAVVVRAEDGLGRLQTGFNGPVTVALSANPGGATLGGTLTVNAVAGIATFTNLTINALASGYQLSASASGYLAAGSTPFNATAGAATQLTFTQQPTSAAPNTAIAPPVIVTARDGQGNVATSFAGAVTLGFGANPGGAVFGGTVTVNAVAGVATFPDVRVSLAGVGYTLTAAATGLTGATSTAFTINDNTATRLEITQQATTVSAGIFMSPELVVTARTASNAVATGFTGDVTVSILSGPGTLCCALTATAVAGVATFPAVTFRIVSGGSTLLVSSPGVAPDTSAPITVTPGTPYQVVIGTQPTNGIAGQPITPPVTASVQDANGNIVTSFVDPVTATLTTNPTGATLGGTLTVVPVNGIATFSDLTVSLPGSGYRLIGGGPGLASVPSAFFSMGAGALVNSWTNAAGGNWSVGTNWSLGRTPIASDTVMILTDGTYTVTMDVSDTVAVLMVGGGTGQQSLALGSRTLRVESAGSIQPSGVVALTVGSNLSGPATVVNNGQISMQGGTVSAPLINTGLVVSGGTSTISGALSTAPGSTLRLLGSVSSSVLTVSSGFTNAGTVELTTQNAGYLVQLSTPTLVNGPTGVITSLAGAGGSRTIAAQLDNQGTINGTTGVTLNLASAAHTNSGTISISAVGGFALVQTGTAPSFTNTGTVATNGGTWTVSGGLLDLRSGLVSGSTGQLSVSGAPTLRFTTATVQPRLLLQPGTIIPDPFVIPAGDSLRIRGGIFAPPTLTNDGTLVLESNATITSDVTTGAGSVIRVRGTSVSGAPTAAFTNPLTNSATIDLTAESAGYAVQLTIPALTNTATGVINSIAGSGGSRTLTTQLTNLGTVNVLADLAINATSASHANSGSILLTAGDLTITQTGTAPSFTNTGTVATNGRTLTVTNGTLDLTAGLVSGFAGRLATTGTASVRFLTTTVQPRVTGSAATVLPAPFVIPAGDSLRVRGGTFAPPSLTNNGTLLLESNAIVTSNVTTGTGSVIRVRASSAGGGSVNAAFTNVLTNSATLEMTAEDAGYTMVLTAPGIVNTSTGVINVLAGSGGPRTMVTQLNNQGTINLPYDLSVTGASAAHTNSGTITLTTGDFAVTQSGTTPSFTNTGTIAANTRTFTVAGGTLDLTAGLVSGFGGRLITTGTPTVRFVTTTVQPRVTFSATTILPDPFVVPAGDSLRILSGSFSPPSLTNNGTLLLEGSPTLTTALTTGTGSLMRVRGTNAGGSATATFTNPITNSTTIDLVAENAGYTVILVAPSVTNTATGVINTVTGSGGTRTLTAQLNNAGVVNLPYDLTINGVNAAHTNTGSILLTTGDLAVTQSGAAPSLTNTGTIATNGRTVTVAGGTLDLSAGLVSGFGGRLITTGTPTVRFLTSTVQPRVTLSAGTVLPDPFIVPASDSLRLLASSFAPPSLTNNGVLLIEGTSTITTVLTTGTGSTLRVRGSSVGGSPVATFTNAITNTATLDLTAESAGYTTTLVAPSVVNLASGVINVSTGSGGTRILTAQLNNAGVVNIPYDLTINGANGVHTNSGSILLTTGDLAITQSGVTPSFTNTGTVATNGRTMTVTNGTLDLSAGLVSGFSGRLVTSGTPTVRFLTSTVQPRVTFSAGTVLPDPFVVPASDSLRLLSSSFAPPSLTNNGVLLLEGTSTVSTALTTATGSTLRVRGSSVGGSPVATFANPITNTATIDLVAQDAGYSVTLVAPLVTNTATGVINSVTGSSGVRTLTAALDNAGVVNVPYDLTINAASATHINSGSIVLSTGDLAITQSGTTPSFTNTGTIVANARTVTVAGGLLDLQVGLISGYAGRLVTTGAPTVRFLTTTVQPRVTFSAGTILPDPFTIPSSDSLRVLGGLFSPPSLINNGVLIVEGSPTLTTALTTGTGSVLRVRGSSVGGSPVATFTNAITNSATIDLVAQDAGYAVTLVAPLVTNTATGVINSVTGSSGTRTLTARLDNAGVVNVPYDLTINAASAAHVNSGSILLSTGDLAIAQSGTTPSFTNTGTVSTNGRTVTVAGGTLDLTTGLVSGFGGRLITTGAPTVRFLTTTVQPRVTLSAGTILPDAFVVPASDSLRLLGSAFAPPSLTNNGTLILEGNSTVSTGLVTGTGSVIRVRGSSIGGSPVVTFTGVIVNTATIDLTSESAGYSVTLVAPGITNAAPGVINSLAGSLGTRTLATDLTNNGVVNVPYDLTLNAAGATQQNNGTINLSTGDLTVTQSGTSPSFTNTGTILMNGRTMTVGGGTLDLTAGLLNGYTGRLITTGTPTVRFTTATVQPRVTLAAGTVMPDPFIVPANDSLRLLGSAFAPPTLTNNGLMIVEGISTITTAFTTGTGSTLRVRGSSVGGSPNATFTNGFTNTATIELTAQDAGYTATLTAPSITNAAAGVIRSVAGIGGTRILAAQLDNSGLLDLPYDLTINRASAAHVNNGTITMSTGDLTITQSGTTPSFTNTGTIAVNARTMTIGAGSVNLTSGLVSGFGGRVTTTGTTSFDFLPAAVQPRLTLSAGTTIPSAITVAVGDSLRVGTGSFNAPSVTVNGALVLEGGVTVSAPITTNAGSLMLVRGSSAGGGSVIATLQAPLSNSGTLRLAAQDAGYGVTLNLGANTLTNAAGGTLDLSPVSAGSRTLTAGLVENLGTLTANYTTAFNAPLNQRGLMTVASGQILTVQGLLQLFTGSTTTAIGTIVKTGTCANLGGSFTGFTCP